MPKQLPSSPSSKKIGELYKRIKEGTLVLQPEFQRKLVWSSKHKEAFIDTILKGLPFPEIYTAQSGIDIEKIETREVVVDGQQRLSTIVQYIDESDDSNVFGKMVDKFSDLGDVRSRDFLNYNVVIRDLEDIPSDVIREIFKRINQTKFSLQQVEIQNAVYDGEFISTAKEILNSIDTDHVPIFSESEISRMSDLQFVLLVMSTLEVDGYFSRDSDVEKCVAMYNDYYPNKDTHKSMILNVLNDIKNLRLEPDSIWYRKSNFYTLVVELCHAQVTNVADLLDRLNEFEKNVLESKFTPRDKNDYATYYGYMYTGTNSRQARVIRGNMFRKYVLGISEES